MPKKHKHLLHTLFFLVAIFSFASGTYFIPSFLTFLADFEDLVTNIYSVSTDPNSVGSSWRRVSLEGGSYLYIKGAGFSTRSASSNRVTLDDTNCPVIGKLFSYVLNLILFRVFNHFNSSCLSSPTLSNRKDSNC